MRRINQTIRASLELWVLRADGTLEPQLQRHKVMVDAKGMPPTSPLERPATEKNLGAQERAWQRPR